MGRIGGNIINVRPEKLEEKPSPLIVYKGFSREPWGEVEEPRAPVVRTAPEKGTTSAHSPTVELKTLS